MRVCMLSYSYYESDNRVRRYAESLVQRGATVDVIAICRKKQPRYENIRGVHVYRIQTREKNEKMKLDYLFRLLLFFAKSFLSLTLRHLRTPYDLVHVHSVPDFEVFAALVPKMLGAIVILDIHDIVPEFYAGKFNSDKMNFLTKSLIAIERLCCNFAHHVIISNDLWRELLLSRSVSGNKCTTILNYPDTTIFKKEYRNKKDNGKDFIVMYPGSLNYHQGLDIAVNAMSIVNGKLPEVKLHIYGVGPLLALLVELIDKNNLQNTVFIHKPLSLEEIAEKMAYADLGIVPKRAEGFGNEAFSTKIFEFMALGVPVLASATKIDQYYFNDAQVEFFSSENVIQLAEKIEYLYYNEERRIEMVNSSLKLIDSNDWEEKKCEYFALIESLCGIKNPVENAFHKV